MTLLFGASGVFGELQGALNTIWNVKPKPGRGILSTIRDRFLSFGMVLAVGFLLLVTLIINTALAGFGGFLEGLVPGLAVIMQIANSLLSFLPVTALFAMIFKFLPARHRAFTEIDSRSLLHVLQRRLSQIEIAKKIFVRKVSSNSSSEISSSRSCACW